VHNSYRLAVDRRRRWLVTRLIAVQLGDAVFNAFPTQWLKDDLDHLGIPEDMRLVFPVVKSASAVGLYLGLRRPQLGRLTAAALVVYFVLALGAHARVSDPPLKAVPAAGMLAWSVVAYRAFSRAATPAR
jgi:hypothetical protein